MEPTEPKNLPEIQFTPEQKIKTDKDIKTLASLTSLAKTKDFRFEIFGGYAVDALVVGKVTRPHNDMDAVVFIPKSSDKSSTLREIEEALEKENTAWHINRIEGKRVELRGVEDSVDERSLELYITYYDPQSSGVLKTLEDSEGVVHEVSVIPLPRLVSDRIRVLVDEDSTRDTKETDIEDLRRLIRHPDFKKEDYEREAIKAYIAQGFSSEQAIERAEENWQNAMMRIDLLD